MPTRKTKSAPKARTMRPAAKNNTPKKSGPKSAAKKPPAKPKPTAIEQRFLAAIRKTPDDLTAHLAYANWLAEQNQGSRAAALRAWAEFARIPVTEVGMKGVVAAYHNYRDSLKLKDAEWIDALEKIRPWISVTLAEKIVRVCLDDARGAAEAVAWTVDVSPCFLDDRWSGGYRGELEANGKTSPMSGAFFINQITGNCSGHVSST